jgi:hypothetical protein
MSSVVYSPFNQNPAAVSVKTASYTIPAGRYARLVVEADSGGTFTIGGVTALSTASFVNVNVSSASAPLTYTTPTGSRSVVSGSTGATGANYQVNSSSSAPGLAANAFSPLYELGAGGTMTVSGGANMRIVGVEIPGNATNRQAVFWVPSGTVINGTGNWRAVVEEYNLAT